MATPKASSNTVPLCISRSYVSTEGNKTGSWRFVRPRYEDKTAPCTSACPVAEDIARVEMLVGGVCVAPRELETDVEFRVIPEVGRLLANPIDIVEGELPTTRAALGRGRAFDWPAVSGLGDFGRGRTFDWPAIIRLDNPGCGRAFGWLTISRPRGCHRRFVSW